MLPPLYPRSISRAWPPGCPRCQTASVDGDGAGVPTSASAEDLGRQLDEQILGPGHLTPADVAQAVGLPLEVCEQLWVELGFPPVPSDEPLFTDADVEVLRDLKELQELRMVTFDTIFAMTRVLGQALSRVATAQVQLSPATAEAMARPSLLTELAPEEVKAAVALSMELNERFIVYSWRRHLAAAVRRQLDPRQVEVIGFADLVNYTKLTSRLDDEALPLLLQRFQHAATQQVAQHGGQVRKLIGDAVLFVVPDPAQAALAALDLRDALQQDPEAPAVRIGLAMGPVVAVEGDIYGDTVNRASRLAELARPDSLLVDDAMGNALLDATNLIVRPLRARRVKGLGLVRCWRVRRPPVESDAS